MSLRASALPAPAVLPTAGRFTRPAVGGLAVAYMSLIVLIPLAAVFAKSLEGGFGTFWEQVTAPQARAAIQFTVLVSLVVTAINVVVGTIIVATFALRTVSSLFEEGN